MTGVQTCALPISQERDLARRFVHFMPSIKRGSYGQQHKSRQLILPTVTPQGFNGNGDRESSASDASITDKIPTAGHETSIDLGFPADAQHPTGFPFQDRDSQCSEPASSNLDPQFSTNRFPLMGESNYSGIGENSLEGIFGNFFDGYEQMHSYTGDGFSSYAL